MSLHVMIDIEALGLTPGSVITEIGLVLFDSETGEMGESMECLILPHPNLTVELDTLAWHKNQGTWPQNDERPRITLEAAALKIGNWLASSGTIETYWSWGSTYDFPHLARVMQLTQAVWPWQYWECSCARTLWRLAFPERQHAPRPHSAVADAKAAVVDLMAAVSHLRAMPGAAEPMAYYRAGLRDLASASALAICAKCGEAGLTVADAVHGLTMHPSLMRVAFARLHEAGLVSTPARDTAQGRPYRYTVTDAGRAVLASPPDKVPCTGHQPKLLI